MDQKTYPNTKVVDLAQKFIPVKINVGNHQDIAEKFNVTAIPSILFLNEKGKVLHDFIGFKSPDDFVKEMQTALSKAKK